MCLEIRRFNNLEKNIEKILGKVESYSHPKSQKSKIRKYCNFCGPSQKRELRESEIFFSKNVGMNLYWIIVQQTRNYSFVIA